MRAIHKFPLPHAITTGDPVAVEMPPQAIRHRFAMQNHVPTIWAEVDTAHGLVPRYFQIFGTGQELPDGAEYVGTFEQGPFVWHLYEVQG